jgi:serine acetyltransferase
MDAPRSSIGLAFRADIVATFDRDPQRSLAEPSFFKGFHAIQTHRLAHWLWQRAARISPISAEPLLRRVPDRHPSGSEG